MYNVNDFTLGTYKHYKKSLYTVFGIADDIDNNKYVIYQTKDKVQELWVRPYDVFIEDVKIDDTTTKPRFKKNSSKGLSVTDSMTNLLSLLDEETNNCFFSFTESDEKFVITNINYDDSSYSILIHSQNRGASAYLTDFELAHRMGYYLFTCNGKNHIRKLFKHSVDNKSLMIVNDSLPISNEYLLSLFSNPCSIDLHIDDKCYYKTKFKQIDLTSLNVVNSQASDYWKKINFKKYHGVTGVKLYPHQSILTHTLEKLQIPSDCAGKIEIKSTYARLSLSVTNSDFCNPGWNGYYPLSIRNDGTNTVILHPKEKMLQLMLVPTNAPIINPYHDNSTYMNDDGTPFKFWRSKTVNALKAEIGNDDILTFFEKKRTEYSGEIQDRFEDTFIKFCEKKKHKYRDHEDKADVKKIFKAYIRRERIYNVLSKIFNKILTGICSAIGLMIALFAWLFPNPDINFLSDYKWHCAIICLALIFTFVISLIANTKHYCTLKTGNKQI